MAHDMKLMEAKNLAYGYKDKHLIFKDVNFSISEGEILAILGRNGAGKSTLLNCLANLFVPKAGQIFLLGQPMREMKFSDVARTIGYVPQTSNPAYAYSVREFVVMGRAPYIGRFSSPSRKDYQLVDEALENMEIAHLAHQPYTSISGGERQQASIAQVIVQQPKIILFDEPTSALDFGNQVKVLKMIRRLAQQGYAVIFTTHNPDHAILLDDQVGILDQNGHFHTGKAREIITEPLLQNIYQTDIRMFYVPEMKRYTCMTSMKENEKIQC